MRSNSRRLLLKMISLFLFSPPSFFYFQMDFDKTRTLTWVLLMIRVHLKVASSARVSADIYPGQPASALASTAPPSAAAAAAAAPSPPMDIQGPVLITHAGLSGPAVLKLSAFAARAMHAVQHKFVLTINFAGMDAEVLARLFREAAQLPGNRRKTVASHTPPRLSALIPKRLYKRLCHRALGAAASGTDSSRKGRNGRAAVTWGDITDANIEALIATFTSAEVNVDGKATYKDEFVTAGGKSRVRLCVHVGVRVCARARVCVFM